MGLIRDRILAEVDNLTRKSALLDDQYKAAKTATESRIATLQRLLPNVTNEIERLITALGIEL